MGSRRYPGRRPLKGWQLTAVVGAAGAMALAGCSSSGSSQRRHRQQQHAGGQRHRVAQRLGHLGVDHVVGQPDQHQRQGRPPGPDQ